jgi:hypothetical protein
MARMSFPESGRDVSGQAAACPDCASPSRSISGAVASVGSPGGTSAPHEWPEGHRRARHDHRCGQNFNGAKTMIGYPADKPIPSPWLKTGIFTAAPGAR